MLHQPLWLVHRISPVQTILMLNFMGLAQCEYCRPRFLVVLIGPGLGNVWEAEKWWNVLRVDGEWTHLLIVEWDCGIRSIEQYRCLKPKANVLNGWLKHQYKPMDQAWPPSKSADRLGLVLRENRVVSYSLKFLKNILKIILFMTWF